MNQNHLVLAQIRGNLLDTRIAKAVARADAVSAALARHSEERVVHAEKVVGGALVALDEAAREAKASLLLVTEAAASSRTAIEAASQAAMLRLEQAEAEARLMLDREASFARAAITRDAEDARRQVIYEHEQQDAKAN